MKALITKQELDTFKELWEDECDPEFIRREQIDQLIKVAEAYLEEWTEEDVRNSQGGGQ